MDKPNHIEYLDFFATSQGEKDTSLPGMQILIDFTSESAQRTLVTSTSIFPTKDAAQQALDMGVEAGMNSTLDQLDSLLKQKVISMSKIQLYLSYNVVEMRLMI